MSIKSKVVEIIKNLVNELPDNYDNIDLFISGILDSLAVMQMIGEIDDAFGIELDVDDVTADNFNTVEHIVKLIDKYQH